MFYQPLRGLCLIGAPSARQQFRAYHTALTHWQRGLCASVSLCESFSVDLAGRGEVTRKRLFRTSLYV